MEKCRFCNKRMEIRPAQRKRLRAFMKKYPWVTQHDMAVLFAVSNARMSEIVRKDAVRGGD